MRASQYPNNSKVGRSSLIIGGGIEKSKLFNAKSNIGNPSPTFGRLGEIDNKRDYSHENLNLINSSPLSNENKFEKLSLSQKSDAIFSTQSILEEIADMSSYIGTNDLSISLSEGFSKDSFYFEPIGYQPRSESFIPEKIQEVMRDKDKEINAT